MMLLERSLLQEFLLFIEEFYGVHVIAQNPPKSGEYARWFLKDHFYLVREIAGDDETSSLNLEVFTADKQVLQKLEETWYQYLMQQMKHDQETNADLNAEMEIHKTAHDLKQQEETNE